ncbi:MAG TPA: hypothetical protein VGL17_14525 [Gemmatimonadaceae bacterium]
MTSYGRGTAPILLAALLLCAMHSAHAQAADDRKMSNLEPAARVRIW